MAKTDEPRNPEEVTVLVFKDNDPARTFQIPLGWINRFGLGVAALVGVTLLSAFFAAKFYRIARKADPTRVLDLEQELSELRSANKALEARTAAPPAATDLTALPSSAPVPTVTVTVTPAEAPPVGAPAGGSALFSALPRGTRDLSADAAKLPISVSPAKLSWSGRSLKVDFNIQYTGTDRGTQQGRIIVLARGPETLLGYPDDVFGRPGSESLLQPKQGEYFSVSRFREVKAEFAPLRSAGQITDIEILILSLDDQLLFHQKLPAPAAKAKPPASPPKKASAAPPSPGAPATETIEPGVDQ